MIHGGAGPELTWERQEPLAERWELAIPWRRGFEPSPRSDRQDFDADADDILELLERDGPAHLAGFSYGGLGTAIATGRRPHLIHTLTLIEPPFFALALDQPPVRELLELSTSALAGDDPDAEAAFFALAGLGTPETTDERTRAVRLARGLRPPVDAEADWDAIVAADVPSLIVSGDHATAIERVCDAVAERLHAEHTVLAGAGHPAQRTPAFNRVFERHMRGA